MVMEIPLYEQEIGIHAVSPSSPMLNSLGFGEVIKYRGIKKGRFSNRPLGNYTASLNGSFLINGILFPGHHLHRLHRLDGLPWAVPR